MKKLGEKGEGEVVGGIIGFIVLVLFIWAAIGIWNWGYGKFGPKTYTAYFYPNPDNLDNYRSSPVGSVNECRDWVSEQISNDFDGYYDYECGVNCKYSSEYGLSICKETIQ